MSEWKKWQGENVPDGWYWVAWKRTRDRSWEVDSEKKRRGVWCTWGCNDLESLHSTEDIEYRYMPATVPEPPEDAR